MIQLSVTFMDHSTYHYQVDNQGWRFDSSTRQIIIGRGVPRLQIPLDSVRHYEIERLVSPERQASSKPVIAYRSKGGRVLRCLSHKPQQSAIESGNFLPVTADDIAADARCTYPILLGDGSRCDSVIRDLQQLEDN